MEYRVLARKYRPANFDDLIGQEVLVRTLTNAIAANRIAHAFLLTGIRGIGKTTTARIIARALNCIGEDGQGGPTASPCGVCTHCKMISEDRHVDVLEMDAASHTGVNDIRELIDAVHYLPASARYKIYIIDEVHMLSNSAFNALLKTLEEPPPHVKFIFATTEVRKIPVTILSRCQRFDLKRVETQLMQQHLAKICGLEETQAEDEALKLLALAAEGSVRDGLSLLDQAIAHSHAQGGAIQAEAVRKMLGMADRTHYFDLLNQLLSGNAAEAMQHLRNLHREGADVLLVFQDLLELVHLITRIKMVPSVAQDVSYAEEERRQAADLSAKLSIPVLSRLWQMLLKGTQEMRYATNPLAAGEMLLVRIAYAANLPLPADVVAKAEKTAAANPPSMPPSGGGGAPSGGGYSSTSAVSRPASNLAHETQSRPVPEPTAQARPNLELAVSRAPAKIEDFEQLVGLFEQQREPMLHHHLVHDARLVSFEQGKLEVQFAPNVPREASNRMAQLLSAWTGQEWKIAAASGSSTPTLHEQREALKSERIAEASGHPLVAEIMTQFPGAKIRDVTND